MKKKILALSLCVVMLAIAIVGGTLAYFTDTKSATNTFTVGNVKIDLIESRFHREGNDNSGDTSIPDPTQTASGMEDVTDGHKAFTDEEIKADAETYMNDYLAVKGKNMVPGRGVAKCPYVVNTGANDAYIRIRVMIPSAANNDFVAVKDGGVITNQWCSTALKGATGKPAEFRCHIVEVREKSAYELDDVFAKEVGGCQTLEEMKQKLRQSLQDYYDERAEMEVQDTLMRQAAATLDYTPSAQELKEGIDAQVELLKAQLGRKGLTLEAYLQFTGKTEQQIRDDAKPEAENSLRIQKSAERIALLEGLTATDEDYANELAAICRQNGLTMEQLKPHMNAQFEASVRDNIRMKKAIAFVRANADVTVVDAPASKD